MVYRSGAGALGVILALAAGPALSQSVSCGGVGDGAGWIGGAAAASDVATSAGPLQASGVSAAQDGRYVALFSVASDGEYRVEALRAGPADDPLLEVFDASGALVVIDDDSGGDLSSRAELPLAAGQYCIALSGFAGQPVTADLQVSRLDQPAITVGLAGGFVGTEDLPPYVGVQPCLPATPAVDLGGAPGATIDGFLTNGAGVTQSGSAANTPYYRFTLGTTRPVTIRAEGPDADPYIYVFDGQGTLLGENDDSGNSLNSRVDFRDGLQPGSYCIGMRALNDPDVPIALSVRLFDAVAEANEQFAYAEAAPMQGDGYPVADMGLLPSLSVRDAQVPGDRAAFFSFEVREPGLVLITANEVSDSDPWLRLFDSAGRLVAENDDANGTLNSELAARVWPGRYTIGLRQYSERSNGVIRLAVQRYVPAP